MIVKALDIKSRVFCWKQCTYSTARMKPKLIKRVMERCIYEPNHSGRHSWEFNERKDNSPS